MRYLITGGAGFIGSNIAHQLVGNGETVRILDNFSTGRRGNLSDIDNQVEVIEGDICDFETVSRAVEGVNYVLHLAALPSVPRSVKEPLISNAVNVTGTLNVLEASRLAGVRKLVSSSSSSVYGESEELPKHERMQSAPLSPYAVTKLTGEHYCRVYWELYRFPTASLRYFNIFGPRQNPDSEYAAVIPKFIMALLGNEKPVVFGNGEQSRDFTFVDNAVQANLLAATDDKIVGSEFNVACGCQFNLNELLDNLRRITGINIDAHYESPRPGDILHSYADISKLEAFGYKPTVQFSDGLEKTVQYFKNVSRLPSSVSNLGG